MRAGTITTILSALAFGAAFPAAALDASPRVCPNVPPAPAGGPLAKGEPASDPASTRIVVVEWKIKQGRECEFLEYWATKSTVPDRTGLVGEFMSEVDRQPWVNWKLGEGYTTFYNVGIWRAGDDFQGQIGKFIDNARPPLDFEAERRTRVFLAPDRWRIGATPLPVRDADGVR